MARRGNGRPGREQQTPRKPQPKRLPCGHCQSCPDSARDDPKRATELGCLSRRAGFPVVGERCAYFLAIYQTKEPFV